MENRGQLLRRLIVLFGILFGFVGIAVTGLFSLQLVNGEEYSQKAERRLTTSTTVSAARGEIFDRNGTPLVTNKTIYSIQLDYAHWDQETQNDIILKLSELTAADGITLTDSLPITAAEPYEYIGDAESEERKALRTLVQKENFGATSNAAEMLDKLATYYEVDTGLSAAQKRMLVGVRYQMEQTEFSLFGPYTFAKDISKDLVAKIEERQSEFKGVDVVSDTVRQYDTTAAAHLLGRTGPIFAEEWEDYKAKGYSLNDIVGKDGLEKGLEDYLRGTEGAKQVETNVAGNVVGEISAVAPKPGDNCVLTIDLELQKAAEESLARVLSGIGGSEGGAAVVLDVNSGEVLACASYPTYNLSSFSEDYQALHDNALNPLFNRAIAGTYAPGSTYKVLSAIAGLEEGAITLDTHITCNHLYTYFAQPYRCMGTHGSLDVVHALQKSCNVFFYETGRRLTGAKLETWATQFGLGAKTGIEIGGEKSGIVAGPTSRAKLMKGNPNYMEWTAGDDIHASIGQSDNAFTPIQLANYVATVANGGTHYQAHFLKKAMSYDFTETVKNDTPNVLNRVKISDSTLNAVKTGMHAVVSEGGTAARVFANYPVEIAGKSGTAQTGQAGKNDNGVFVAFGPYENPEIAICVVGEGAESGSNVAQVVRDIFDQYFDLEDGKTKETSATTDKVTGDYTILR